jgi:phosphomannomutase
MSLMVSISGIRGIVGETLTPETIVKYASAFARYCGGGGTPLVIVGRDGRCTGAFVTDLITGALRAAGANVRLLGICPTPTVQMAVEHERAAGGISVTASHNPMQWNGMKFVAPTGMFLDGEENRKFWAMAGEPGVFAPWEGIGTLTHDGSWIQRHIDAVLALPYIRPEAIRARQFRIVVDCVNAAGGLIVPPMLRALGCDVAEMNCEVSGIFRHTPEPIPENLSALSSRVKQEKADLGIAVDPDVDRLVLIMENGEPYGEEYTVATAVKFVLEKTAGAAQRAPVVVNLSTTRAVEEIARASGVDVQRTPVGEINVAKRMVQLGSMIGGEGSGGVILPAVHAGRDAIVGIGLLLQFLAEAGMPLSRVKESLPRYAIAKGKIALGAVSPNAALRRVADVYRDRARLTTDDGLKLDFPESWVHLRASNTEPILRVIAEARTAEEARSLVNSFTALISAS